MKNLVSIFAGHDANITFYNADKDEYHLIELERLVKKRYFRLHVDNSPEYQKEILTLCQEIAEEGAKELPQSLIGSRSSSGSSSELLLL